MVYDLRFVDSIAASPTVRLDLNAAPWTARVGTEFGMPELKRSVVSTLLRDGDTYPAAAYGNRTLSLLLRVDAATDDDAATQLQLLYRELNRANNILLYRPGTSQPVFFRTFRCGPDAVQWDPFTKEVRVVVPAEPFALGLRETLPAVTVYNDPAEGTTLNANPFIETDASNWTVQGGGTAVRSTAQFHEGAASLLLTPNGVGVTAEVLAELVPVTAGQQYRPSAWVRCAVARNVNVSINWHASGGSYISTAPAPSVAVAATTWTLIDGTYTAPVGAAQARLVVSMSSTPSASHLLYIDEARLRLAGGVGGMCFDVTSPKGDVEAPLYLQIPAADVVVTGRRQSAIAVRRRGTPSGMPSVLQAEAMTVGSDTTVQANSSVMSGTGSNWTRTTFAGFTSLVTRLTANTFPASPSVDVRGTYRVFARTRKSVSGDVITMRLSASIDGAAIDGDTVTLPSSTDLRWVDLGLLQFPLGYDPVTDGPSGVTLPVRGVEVRLAAGRTSGSGNLDIDCLMFVPADDRLVFVQWPEFSGPTNYVVDSEANTAYGVGTIGEVRPTVPVDFAGGAPMASPGVTNRVVMLQDVGDTSLGGDVVTETMAVTPYYWPRYLTVRPLAT